MEIKIVDNYDVMSGAAAEVILGELGRKPDMLMCTAGGKSPSGTYGFLAGKYREYPELFDRLRIIKLDEWGGISRDNPQSCEVYLQEKIVKPLHIKEERYISFDSNPKKPEEECTRIATCLKQNGPVDVCVLGLGLNGHIAFNEPGNFLQPHCHIAILSERSMQHPMAIKMGEIPSYGMTLGISDILQSKKIIMLVTGSGKKEIIDRFLSGKVTSELPASFLWLHEDVICLVDKKAI